MKRLLFIDYDNLRVKGLTRMLRASIVTPSRALLLTQTVKSSHISYKLLQTLKLQKKGLMGTLTLYEIISEGRNNELCHAQTCDME